MRSAYLSLCLVTVAACSSDVKPTEAPARKLEARAVGAAKAPTFDQAPKRLKRATLMPSGQPFGAGMRAGELKLMSGGRWVVVKSWSKDQGDASSAALVDTKTGQVEAVEQWVALAPDLSSGVFRAQGKLWRLDASTGQRVALEASLRQDRRSELHEGMDRDFNYGRAVSYAKAGDVMSVILPGDRVVRLLKQGQVASADFAAPEGELIWRAEPAEDGTLRIWTVKSSDDFEHSAGPRRMPEGLCGTAMHRMMQARRIKAKAWRWDGSRWSLVQEESKGTSSRVKVLAGKWRWRYADGHTSYTDLDGSYKDVIEGCGSSAQALPATYGAFAFFHCGDERQYLYDFEREQRQELPADLVLLDPFNARYGFDHHGEHWAAVASISQGSLTKMSGIGRLRLRDAKLEWLAQDVLERFGERRLYDYWPDAPSRTAAFTEQGLALMDLGRGESLTATRAELGEGKHIVLIPTQGAFAISPKPVLSQVANGCVLLHGEVWPPAEDAGMGAGPWQAWCPQVSAVD